MVKTAFKKRRMKTHPLSEYVWFFLVVNIPEEGL
jgi:hypothetical protein